MKRTRFWLLLWDKVPHKPQALLVKYQRNININSINMLSKLNYSTQKPGGEWQKNTRQSKQPQRLAHPFLVSEPQVQTSLWTKEQSQACHTALLTPPLLSQERNSCVSALPWHLHRLPSRNGHRHLQVSPTAVTSALLCSCPQLVTPCPHGQEGMG